MTKSNVFALPMVRRSNEMRDAYGEFICDYPNEVCAEFAVNAINHADALADALESMLEHEKEMAHSVWNYNEDGAVTFEESIELARFKRSFADELAALAAYRGAK